MPRRTAITPSSPTTMSPDSSSPTVGDALSTPHITQSQPVAKNGLARGIVNEAPSLKGSDAHVSVAPTKLIAQAAKKKIVRPPKYHQTRAFLDKECAVQAQVEIPSHLGHRVGESYRLAATIARSIEQAALRVRPVSWGYGTKDGALGHDNSEHHVEALKRVAALRRDHVHQASAGDKLSLFLASTGRVMICGRLFLHQDGIRMWKPQEVSFVQAVITRSEDPDPQCASDECEPNRIVSVEAGHLAAYAIDDRGRVFAWGTRKYGQLGLGDSDETKATDTIECDSIQYLSVDHERSNPGDSETDDTDEDTGMEKPMLRRHDPVEITPRIVTCPALANVRVIKLSAGNHFVVAMASCGRAFSWGRNTHGQLGLGESVPCGGAQSSPRQIQSRLESAIVVDIAAGHSHSLVVAVARASRGDKHAVNASYSMVFAFGRGARGCLGIGGDHDQLEPVEVNFFRGLQPTNVAAGHDHSLVLCTVGSTNFVYAFGGNQFGQLGIGQSTMSHSDMPMAVDELCGRTITSVGAGAYVSSALSGDGEIYTWGDGAHGKTARPDTRTTFVPWKIPTQGGTSSEPGLVTGAVNHRVVLDGDGFVTQLSMGAHHSIALYRTEGKPDRWRKIPMGPIAASLEIPGCDVTLSDSIVCASASTRSPLALFGIALHCEPCAVGPLCRVCARRCHGRHRLVPRSAANNPTPVADSVVCACGRRRPPPLRPSPPSQPHLRRSSTPAASSVQGAAGGERPKLDDTSPMYCAMTSVPHTIPEDTEILQ